MEFDWMNMLLEGVNFLVLVWLLKRFFYLPVLAVIERRQANSEKITLEAEALRHEAEALKQEFEQRQAEAQEAREQANACLEEDIAKERTQRMAVLSAELDAERQRRKMLDEREHHTQSKAMQREAIAIAARFASRLLDQLAGPELDRKLIDLALLKMEANGPDKPQELYRALQDPAAQIKVVSAYPLDPQHASRFSALLGNMAGRVITPQYSVDAALKSGLYLMVDSWVLMANLRDELNFFTENLDHGA